MAINPDNSHECRHMFLCGCSGSGKSSFLRRLNLARLYQRVIYWDPDEDHKAEHCYTRASFKRAVMRGVASGKKFRVAYTPDKVTQEEFEFWCGVFWAALDGSVLTAGVVEELADVTGTAKAKGTWGQLSRKARKYGGHIYSVSQRPAEIDKSILSQSPIKWCGQLETPAERDYLSRVLGIQAEALQTMPANIPGKKCHFYIKYPGPDPAKPRVFNPVQGAVTI
ncbi:hypothetical protein [Microbulbifer sp. SAOS-129_SWC]|uniref:ATP-binding protein n=1 Tax=Microbulbifer sp. SAOS-129_SWC TaxID=3145235 RepID=UPI003217DD74